MTENRQWLSEPRTTIYEIAILIKELNNLINEIEQIDPYHSAENIFGDTVIQEFKIPDLEKRPIYIIEYRNNRYYFTHKFPSLKQAKDVLVEWINEKKARLTNIKAGPINQEENRDC